MSWNASVVLPQRRSSDVFSPQLLFDLVSTEFLTILCEVKWFSRYKSSPYIPPAGVHGGGDDASPAGSERRCLEEPLPEGQEEEGPVACVGPLRPPGQLASRSSAESLSTPPHPHNPLLFPLRSTSTNSPRSLASVVATCASQMRRPCWRNSRWDVVTSPCAQYLFMMILINNNDLLISCLSF